MARAKELAEQSHNPAACFHVARQLESDDQVAEALQFFAQAGAYGGWRPGAYAYLGAGGGRYQVCHWL